MKVILYVGEYEFRKYDFGNNIINVIGKPAIIEHQIIGTGEWVSVYNPESKSFCLGNCPNLRVTYDNLNRHFVDMINELFHDWIKKNNISTKQQRIIITD